MRILNVLIILFGVLSCQMDTQASLVSKSTVIKQSDNLELSVDKPIIEGSQLMTALRGDDLYRVSPFSSSIQKVNLITGRANEISLTKEGPGSIRRVNGIAVSGKKGVTIFSDHSIYEKISDSDSIRATRFYPRGEELRLEAPYIVRVDANHPIYAYQNGFLISLEREDSDKFSFPYHYQGYLFGVLDTDLGEVTPLQPRWTKEASFYGGLHATHYCLVDNKLIYGFQYGPELHLFDLVTGVSSRFKVPPFDGRANDPFIGSHDPTDAVAHMGKSISYEHLLHDRKNDMFFQICKVQVKEDHPNYGQARRYAIRAFDTNLNLLADLRLPGYYTGEAFCRGGYLYLRYTKDVDEDRLLFHKFSIVEES